MVFELLSWFNEMKAESLNAITKLVDSGELKAEVDTVLPLSEARRASELTHRLHARGNRAQGDKKAGDCGEAR